MLRDTPACKSSTNYVYDFGGKNLNRCDAVAQSQAVCILMSNQIRLKSSSSLRLALTLGSFTFTTSTIKPLRAGPHLLDELLAWLLV
jgi:hypothetical protein